MKNKKFWESKLFWVNLAAVVTAVADNLLGLKILTPETYAYIIGGLGTLNIILRLFFTDTNLTA